MDSCIAPLTAIARASHAKSCRNRWRCGRRRLHKRWRGPSEPGRCVCGCVILRFWWHERPCRGRSESKRESSESGQQAWGKNIMNSRGSMVSDPIKLFERKLAKAFDVI